MILEIDLRDALKTQDTYRDGNWEYYGVKEISSNAYEIEDEDTFDEFKEHLIYLGINMI